MGRDRESFKLYGKDCPICGVAMTVGRGPKQAVKDHCHVTGNKRSVICFRCNIGLGMFKDSIEILVSAVVYLQVIGDKALPQEGHLGLKSNLIGHPIQTPSFLERAANALGIRCKDLRKALLIIGSEKAA